ncbi:MULTISPECIES: excalibur calcium-binding domain-containing protein [unclassified Arthrobacter]|uniref:excalibur calcium-binding domain-containing protein n=1 Tax=unclassified Arthrobacter TaxID=235627 RepID=UPI000475B8F4|nr:MULTISPECIES: excalibur calcium-binding domain-containing protein [unclassified Arthrobacter]BCW53571.1 hypothetical protein StoSoilB19_09450 [Arthrobacter sp. StoSoilB19]
MKTSPMPAAGRLKKTLALAVLAGLMLTGCGGKQAATQPAAAATAVAQTIETVTVPSVTGLALDKATDQLKDLGFEVDAKDTAHGKSIMVKSNWQVTTQDPANGAKADKGSTVHLGVKSLDDIAAEKAAADKAAADKAAAEKAAAAAKAAAEKAAADKAAADQAAAAKAAAAKQAAQAPAPAPVAVPAAPAPVQAPAAAYYANCTAAKAAGAAPLYRGQSGYSSSLDRDGDGVACER